VKQQAYTSDNPEAATYNKPHYHDFAQGEERHGYLKEDVGSVHVRTDATSISIPTSQNTSVLGQIHGKDKVQSAPLAQGAENIPSKIALSDIFHCFYQHVYWDIPVIGMKSFEQLLDPGVIATVEINIVLLNAVILLAIPYLSGRTLQCLQYESRCSAIRV
jgi:hypothetical protein